MTPASKAFTHWRDCIKRQKELRKQLTLPENNAEDYRMCRNRYRAYMKVTLNSVRQELGIVKAMVGEPPSNSSER